MDWTVNLNYVVLRLDVAKWGVVVLWCYDACCSKVAQCILASFN